MLKRASSFSFCEGIDHRLFTDDQPISNSKANLAMTKPNVNKKSSQSGKKIPDNNPTSRSECLTTELERSKSSTNEKRQRVPSTAAAHGTVSCPDDSGHHGDA